LIIGFQDTVENVGDVFWDTVYTSKAAISQRSCYYGRYTAVRVVVRAIVDSKSRDHRVRDSATTWDSSTSSATTMTDRQWSVLPRVGVGHGVRPAVTSSSTFSLGRLMAVRAAGQWLPDRPDSALSNLSELDSGYDELRSFTVTPVIPPELIVTGPDDDLLPPDMTSVTSVDHHDKQAGDLADNNKWMSSYDLGPTDCCNTSSLIDQEDQLSLNIGTTGNTSAVSLTSLDADCKLSANNSECKALSENYNVVLT